MKARKVKALDPDGTLVDNARRIVLVRLDELVGFAPAVLDPGAVTALHDMRIAAKRLRYVLEVTEPCFGPPAREGVKVARRLQSLLGEIHDCDEMLARVDRHIARLRDEDLAAVRAKAAPGAEDLDRGAARAGPHGPKYRGLEALRSYVHVRREVLYARFVADWAQLEQDGFADTLAREVGDARVAVPA